MDFVETGDFRAFEAEVDAMLELSVELGHPRYRWRPLLLASMRACMHGRFAESERILVEVDQLAALTDDPALPVALSAHRALRARDTEGESTLREIAHHIHRLLSYMPDSVAVGSLLRSALLCRVDRPATTAELARLEPMLAAIIVDLPFCALASEPVALAGSDAARRLLRDRLAPLSGLEAPTGHVPTTYEGSVVRLLGVLDAALGEPHPAIGPLRTPPAPAAPNELPPWVRPRC